MANEPTFDAGDAEQVAERKKDARSQDRSDKEVLRHIMSSADGRSWLFGQLEICHIFHTSFSTEPHRMAFLEGERNVGLQLQAAIVAADPVLFMRMLEERNSE